MTNLLNFTPAINFLRAGESDLAEAQAKLTAHKAEAASFLLSSNLVAVRTRAKSVADLQREILLCVRTYLLQTFSGSMSVFRENDKLKSNRKTLRTVREPTRLEWYLGQDIESVRVAIKTRQFARNAKRIKEVCVVCISLSPYCFSVIHIEIRPQPMPLDFSRRSTSWRAQPRVPRPQTMTATSVIRGPMRIPTAMTRLRKGQIAMTSLPHLLK